MTQIGSHARSSDDIVTGEGGYFGGKFAEEGEGLADASGGSEDGHFGGGGGGCGEARFERGAAGGAEGGECFGGEAIDDHCCC